MVDTELLEKLIDESGKTRTHLCERMGIKALQTLSSKIRNKTHFTMSEIDVLCEELNITKLSDKEKIFNKK